MSKIVAICPYCRRGGVRARANAVGASAHCPKCKSSFTVLPEDNLPDWAAKANADAEFFYQSSPLAETRAHQTLPDKTEPSPIVTVETKAKIAPSVVAAAPQVTENVPTPSASASAPMKPAPQVFAPEEPTPRPATDMGMVFALSALILIGPAMLASQLPYGRVIGIVLASGGLLAGLLSLGAEGRARLVGAGAAFLQFLALVVLVFLPSWLNLEPWQSSTTATQEEIKGPIAIEHGSGTRRALAPNDVLDAGRTSWLLRDTRVTVRAATVGPVELHGPNNAKRTTKEQYVQLMIQLVNAGVEREIPLTGWASGSTTEGVTVTDANGQPLSAATFEAGWVPARLPKMSRLTPGHAVEVYLVYAAPPKINAVHLKLSGAAFGATDEIQFRAGLKPLNPRNPGK